MGTAGPGWHHHAAPMAGCGLVLWQPLSLDFLFLSSSQTALNHLTEAFPCSLLLSPPGFLVDEPLLYLSRTGNCVCALEACGRSVSDWGAVKIAGAEDAGQQQRLFFHSSTGQWCCFGSGCAPSGYQQSWEPPASVGALVGGCFVEFCLPSTILCWKSQPLPNALILCLSLA